MGQEGTVTGRVKWFDSARGFGFIVAEECGGDVLLHANVLRGYGRNSVASGARVRAEVRQTDRGCHAVRILEIKPPGAEGGLAALRKMLGEETALDIDEHLQPARVKWFDRVKGFGFANVFGLRSDIFVHVEVLQACGLSELHPGEAIALRVARGPRGLLAWDVQVWDHALDATGDVRENVSDGR